MTDLDELLTATRDVLALGARTSGEAAPQVQLVLERLPATGRGAPIAPQSHPVVGEHLAAAAALAREAADAALAKALVECAARLFWVNAYPSYAGEPDMDRLRERYSYAYLVGPGKGGAQVPLRSDDVTLAFTLQAPDTFYPSHVHKAPEIYHVVAGLGEWERGAEGWAWRRPGEWIFHASGVRHAMRTHAQPLLAIACWLEDLWSESVIVRG
jgi:hypothetical protein